MTFFKGGYDQGPSSATRFFKGSLIITLEIKKVVDAALQVLENTAYGISNGLEDTW